MKFTKLALTFLSGAILFCGCTKDNSVAIKINDKVVTKSEFYDDYNKIKNSQLKYLPDGLKKDNSYVVLSIKSKYVNDVIVRALLEEEFEKRNITASEEEIKGRIEQIIKQMGSKEAFDKAIKENGISQEKLNSDMANEVKTTKLIDSIAKIKVSDSDVSNFYKQNKSEFSLPERVLASHILFDTNIESIKRTIVAADKDASLSQEEVERKAKEELAKVEALANEVRQKAINNPKNFAQLAKEYSQDPGSAQKGGDLGYIIKEQVVKEFGDMAFSQKVGTISPLVKSQFGTHIIYVKDKSAAQTQSFASVKADIKEFLIKKAKFEAFNNLIKGLKDKAKIEFVDTSLDPTSIEKKIQESLASESKKKAIKK
ncbi:MAG: peptidylprolyl isomerase [Candidatus Gastranaerophilales bacterium]|nr:peptidylprolyl isomerase [Candidatus Gastranaerophilales bacterium]